ncbi:hypothetical protein D3C77_296470 [compost metagenome]
MEIGSKPAAYAGTENGVNRLVFLFALSDGDLPLRPEFPVLVNNAVQWLQAGRTTGLGRLVAGAELEIPLNVEAMQASWVAADGYALDMSAAPIPAAAKEHSLAAVQTVPQLPGLWRFEMKGSDGSVLPGYNLEVIAHPSESAIGQAKPLGFGGGGGASAGAGGENGTENGTENSTENGTENAGAGQTSGDARTSPDASGKASGGAGSNPERSSKHSLTYLAALLALIVIIAEWGVYQRGRSI